MYNLYVYVPSQCILYNVHTRWSCFKHLLLMIETLHEAIYTIPPGFLGFWYRRSCSTHIINRILFVCSSNGAPCFVLPGSGRTTPTSPRVPRPWPRCGITWRSSCVDLRPLNTYIHTYVHTYVHTHTYIGTKMVHDTFIRISIYTSIYIYTHVYRCICCTYIQMYICIHTHIHHSTYTYMHRSQRVSWRP